jgi:hypothetical protein
MKAKSSDFLWVTQFEAGARLFGRPYAAVRVSRTVKTGLTSLCSHRVFRLLGVMHRTNALLKVSLDTILKPGDTSAQSVEQGSEAEFRMLHVDNHPRLRASRVVLTGGSRVELKGEPYGRVVGSQHLTVFSDLAWGFGVCRNRRV